MKRKWIWIGSVVAVLAIGVLAVAFWPTGDPLARVETIAIQAPNWGKDPQGEIIREPFIDGLVVFLGDKNITIVGNVDEADAVLAIEDIQVMKIEISIQEGQVRGRVVAACVLTELWSGKEHTMDFYLTLNDEEVEAKLVSRKFWQFWRDSGYPRGESVREE